MSVTQKVRGVVSRVWDVPIYLGAGALAGSTGQRPNFGGFEDVVLGLTGVMWMFTNGGSSARLTRNAYIGVFGIAATAAAVQPSLEAKVVGTGAAVLSGMAAYVMERDHKKADALYESCDRY